jgi:hypothetical protein
MSDKEAVQKADKKGKKKKKVRAPEVKETKTQ